MEARKSRQLHSVFHFFNIITNFFKNKIHSEVLRPSFCCSRAFPSLPRALLLSWSSSFGALKYRRWYQILKACFQQHSLPTSKDQILNGRREDQTINAIKLSFALSLPMTSTLNSHVQFSPLSQRVTCTCTLERCPNRQP